MQAKDRSNALVGIILIAIGVVLLIGTMGWADVGAWYRWLPAILIIVGLYQLYLNKFQALFGPLILICVGVVLLLATLGVISWGLFGALWPLLLVIFGLSILFGRGRMTTTAGYSGDRVSAMAFLGGAERRISSKTFRGGEVTSFMGGVELDFRDADVADKPATLNINTMMGGVEIRVPDTWVVDLRVSALLGGVEDERKGRVAAAQDGSPPHLVITGLAIMGGVTIKS